MLLVDTHLLLQQPLSSHSGPGKVSIPMWAMNGTVSVADGKAPYIIFSLHYVGNLDYYKQSYPYWAGQRVCLMRIYIHIYRHADDTAWHSALSPVSHLSEVLWGRDSHITDDLVIILITISYFSSYVEGGGYCCFLLFSIRSQHL